MLSTQHETKQGPLYGLVCSVKDCIPQRGFDATCGMAGICVSINVCMCVHVRYTPTGNIDRFKNVSLDSQYLLLLFMLSLVYVHESNRAHSHLINAPHSYWCALLSLSHGVVFCFKPSSHDSVHVVLVKDAGAIPIVRYTPCLSVCVLVCVGVCMCMRVYLYVCVCTSLSVCASVCMGVCLSPPLSSCSLSSFADHDVHILYHANDNQ